MVRLTDRPAMTIAVDLGRKATKQTNKQNTQAKQMSTISGLRVSFICIGVGQGNPIRGPE